MDTTTEVQEPEAPTASAPNIQKQFAERPRQQGQPAAPPVGKKLLFADVLLEPGSQRRGRTLATTLSFALQCLLVAALLIAPLMFTDKLPTAQLVTF